MPALASPVRHRSVGDATARGGHAMNTVTARIEACSQNRYRVDAGRPHIEIRRPGTCADRPASRRCTHVRPWPATRAARATAA